MHVIGKLVLDLQLPGNQADGFDVQQRIARFCNDILLPALSDRFDGMVGPDEWLTLERLDIEVDENIDLNDADNLCRIIVEAIDQKITALRIAEENEKDSLVAQSLASNLFYKWLAFLESGQLPFLSSVQSEAVLQEKVLETVSSENSSVAALQEVLQNQPVALLRMIRQHDEPYLQKLAEAYTGVSFSHIEPIRLRISKAFRLLADINELETLIKGSRHPEFWQRIQVSREDHIQRLHIASKSLKETLWLVVWKEILDRTQKYDAGKIAYLVLKEQLTLPVLSLITAGISKLAEKESDALQREISTFLEQSLESSSLGSPSVVEIAEEIERRLLKESQNKERKDEASEAGLEDLSERASEGRDVEERLEDPSEQASEDWESEDEVEDQEILAQGDDLEIVQAGEDDRSDKQDNSEEELPVIEEESSSEFTAEDQKEPIPDAEEPMPPVSESGDSIPDLSETENSDFGLEEKLLASSDKTTVDVDSPDERTDEPAISDPIEPHSDLGLEGDLELAKAEEIERKRHRTSDDVDLERETLSSANEAEWYVEGAGIVLLHHFIPELFRDLGLVEGNTFKSLKHRQEAVYVLRYLSHGEWNAPEYNLLLPKFLCEWPIDEPVERVPPLTEESKQKCLQLLEIMIQYWKALGSTSPEGLQEGFLRRPGKLVKKYFDGWMLHVEPSGIDVLLTMLPPGISLSMVKLPWMKELLYIDWDAK